ncbi:formin-like protein 5 isoform X1 [Iris pallida]|uniref:Formin-like protein 5 isoform X1 n=1 Tax=Iris pallida TaxID=29817 RepID=A0AAX6E7B0_IRIPA|nr:formin-like protein 5 isoform X1 [Iris pallida]
MVFRLLRSNHFLIKNSLGDRERREKSGETHQDERGFSRLGRRAERRRWAAESAKSGGSSAPDLTGDLWWLRHQEVGHAVLGPAHKRRRSWVLLLTLGGGAREHGVGGDLDGVGEGAPDEARGSTTVRGGFHTRAAAQGWATARGGTARVGGGDGWEARAALRTLRAEGGARTVPRWWRRSALAASGVKEERAPLSVEVGPDGARAADGRVEGVPLERALPRLWSRALVASSDTATIVQGAGSWLPEDATTSMAGSASTGAGHSPCTAGFDEEDEAEQRR